MLDEDLDAFFDLDDHASEITHLRTGETVAAIFDQEYIEAFDTATKAPFLTMKEDQGFTITRGDKFKIGLITYEAVNLEPDGTGVLRVQLTKL